MHHLARIALITTAVLGAQALDVLLPLTRTTYQTNEDVPIAVVLGTRGAEPPTTLEIEVSRSDGSALRSRFTLSGSAVEHLVVDARHLRPGDYRISATVGGSAGATEVAIVSHIRRSDFRIINWGRTTGRRQLALGEESLGYNLFYGMYAKDDDALLMRAGLDFVDCCTMSGGHQMDLRAECDWSDPNVVRGGTVRAAQSALSRRTRGNVPGVHFYDEPGLTWLVDPATGKATPHAVPSQRAAYNAAYGEPPIDYKDVDPSDAADLAAWKKWARYKLGFMEAAWWHAGLGVSHVEPTFASITQSQYGFSAFTDGYYFNVVRSLPITSGHGGYDDWGPGYYNPSYTLEVARARDLAKPCWYLPTWYSSTPWDRFRAEQYLSFQTGIQGMMTPPDCDPAHPADPSMALPSEGIVESNQLMARLGTIFTTMGPTRAPLAILYSLSDLLDAQARDRAVQYAHEDDHGRSLPFAYLAAKLIHQPAQFVVDEDVVDGSLAAHHRAVLLPAVSHLDAPVIAALERFVAGGGLVLLDADCTIEIAGAVKLDAGGAFPDAERIAELVAAGKTQEAGALQTMKHFVAGSTRLAEALSRALANAGIAPAFACDQPGISATRHAAGDVEYLFAVNATSDPAKGPLALAPAVAEIRLQADGRPIYDAVRGGAVGGVDAADGRMRVSFGPGQMRVFARTTRAIGGVRAHPVIVERNTTSADQPLRLQVSATLVDVHGDPLCGSVPMRIRVVDPTGSLRHDVYRATRLGTIGLGLPLGVNDPAGVWTVSVEETLTGTSSQTTFALTQPTVSSAIGSHPRAVGLDRDREHVFRFAHQHRSATIVHGSRAADVAAAERARAILARWGVAGTIVAASALTKRTIVGEAAVSWVNGHGLDAGWDLPGHAVVIGHPESNPVLARIADAGVLPYPISAAMPGPGRGYVAWQRDIIAHGVESITLIGEDERGLSEALGTFADAVAGMRPLTRLIAPEESTVLAATRTIPRVSELRVLWQSLLPDRVMRASATDGSLIVASADGSTNAIDKNGAVIAVDTPPSVIAEAAIPEAVRAQIPVDRIVKRVAIAAERVAVGCWGGSVLVFTGDRLTHRRQSENDICALSWIDDVLVVALADGRVQGLTVAAVEGQGR
ncbi:MAG TPA: hypothetical protein VEL07_10730 [Planctomycetota bacterium]|nr:hypothetical protein [Planctomycetota bacterium]